MKNDTKTGNKANIKADNKSNKSNNKFDNNADKKNRNTSKLSSLLIPVIAIGVLLLLMMWQSGAFSGDRIEPGKTSLNNQSEIAGNAKIVPVEMKTVPVLYKTVGTVRSRTQVELSARLIARVLEVPVRSGDAVTKGTVLVRLDDEDLKAALNQAEQNIIASRAAVLSSDESIRQAESSLKLSETEVNRERQLRKSGAGTQQALDIAETNLNTAKAALAQAKQGKQIAQAQAEAAEQAKRQAESMLAYATIVSPFDGIVSERFADPGDLASPGTVLMKLFDPSRLMLEIPVRESLASRIKLHETIPFTVRALNRTVNGEVQEIVPAVDPGSRTFMVKLCILEQEGLMPGMFGTLEMPVGTREAFVVPEKAVESIGQLEYIIARKSGADQFKKMLVRTAPLSDGKSEVISGLQEGMEIAL